MRVKGITPVVATVLLLFIAVSAVGAAAVFLEDTIDGVQTGLEDDLEREEMIQASDITIRNGYNATDNEDRLGFDVENSGSVTLEIKNDDGTLLWGFFVDGQPVEPNDIDDGKTLNPNGIESFEVNQDFPEEDEDVEILVTAPYETEDSYICFTQDGERC